MERMAECIRALYSKVRKPRVKKNRRKGDKECLTKKG
jgi:hypothetical protein